MRKIKRTRTKRGGGGCFGAFCSTNNAVKNVIDVSKMDLDSLSTKHLELLVLQSTKETELAVASDPKLKAKLKKELDQLNGEIKLYRHEIRKQTRKRNVKTANATARINRALQAMDKSNPKVSMNDSVFGDPGQPIQRPMTISGGYNYRKTILNDK